MYKMKLLLATAIAIFMAGALTSVTAQKTGLLPIPIIGPLSGTYTMTMTANELSPGDTEYAMAETYGWTCYGETTGDLTGFMFVSMNYSLPEYFAQPVDGISSLEPVLQASKVTGGSWSKLIFIKGKYVGSVYGKIVGGTLDWSSKEMAARMSLELTADNGTGAFADNVGKGTFEGVLAYPQKGTEGSVTGVLTLQY